LRYGDRIRGFFTRFANTGDPNSQYHPLAGNWAPYDPNRDNFLNLGDSPSMEEDFRGEYCDFWDQYN
jgi:hypothetical protein